MPICSAIRTSLASLIRTRRYQAMGARCAPLVSYQIPRVHTPAGLHDIATLAPADQVESLVGTLDIKNMDEVQEQLTLYCHAEGANIDFPRFAEALRTYAGKSEGKRKVKVNAAIFHKLANPELAPDECAENAWMFANPKEVVRAYLDPPEGDYSIIDTDPQIRRCFLGKIHHNDRVLVVAYDDGQLAKEIAARTDKEVVVVCPIQEQVAKMRKLGLKVLKGDPNKIDEILAKAGITGHFSKIVLSECVGETDVHSVFSKLRKYAFVSDRTDRGATKLMITTYLPQEYPDLCGYERMGVERLANLARTQQFKLAEKQTRVFEIYEEDGREEILVSEVSNSKINDGFVYLEFEPTSSKRGAEFSRDVKTNLTCIADVDVPTHGHGAMGFAHREDGSMIITMQCEGIYIGDRYGKVQQNFDGRSLYGAQHISYYWEGRETRERMKEAHRLREINPDFTDHLGFMQDVAIDKDGNVYIGNSYNQGIYVFDKDLRFITEFSTGGEHGEVSKILLDNKGEKLYLFFKGSGLKVFSKDGQCLEEIPEMDGVNLSEFDTFTFTPDGGYCFAGDTKIMVFSKEGKLLKEIKYPCRASVSDVAVNSRGEIFIPIHAFGDQTAIVVYDRDGNLIANTAVDNPGDYGSDFALSSINTLKLLDDDTVMVSAQHPRKLLTFRMGDQKYSDLMLEAVPGDRRDLRQKLEGLRDINLVYANNIEVIMGRLYGLHIRGADLDLIEQVVDLLIDQREQILENFDELCRKIFTVLRKPHGAAQLFFKLLDNLGVDKQVDLKMFLMLAKNYIGVSGSHMRMGEGDIDVFCDFYALIQKMEEEEFVLRKKMVPFIVKGGGGSHVFKELGVAEAFALCQALCAFSFAQYGIKSRDWYDIFANILTQKKRMRKDADYIEAIQKYLEFLPLYCGPDKIPFRVFTKLFQIFGPNQKMFDAYLALFADKEGTFVATREFEESLRGRLALFSDIEKEKKEAEASVRHVKKRLTKARKGEDAEQVAKLEKDLSKATKTLAHTRVALKAKRQAFVLATRNLVWQKHNTQVYTLKPFLVANSLMARFNQHPGLINADVFAVLRAVSHENPLLEREFSEAYDTISNYFALGLMKIDVTALAPEDRKAYDDNLEYYRVFLPLGLKYAKDHPKLLPILKLVFIASLRGEFQRLRNDKDYFPEWLYEYFTHEGEREIVEKFFFKRAHFFALDEVLDASDEQAQAMWAHDDEEVVRVDKRDFQDMISSIVHGAYQAGFAYLSDDFKEMQKTVAALSQDEYVAQMKDFRSIAQELLFVAEMIRKGEGAEQVMAQTKKLSNQFVLKLFEAGDKALDRIEEEYNKIVFRQNIFSAARLANELGNKTSGVAARLTAFSGRIRQLADDLAKYDQLLTDFDLNHPGQQTVRQYKEDLIYMMGVIQEKAPAGAEKIGVMKVLAQMMTLATEFEEYLHVLVNKSNSLAARLQRVGEQHAANGYIDSVPLIIQGGSANITHFRVKDTSDPVDILLALQGQCLDYKSGTNNHGLIDILLNPLVKVNVVRGRNGEEKMLANQMVLLGQIVDGRKKTKPAIVLDQTYGTWGTSREYLLTKIKKTFAKAKRMGQPLVIPVKTLVKVGLMPSKVDKMSEDDFAAAKKEALVKLRAAIGEDLTVHSMRQRKVGFRFFSGAAPHLYTDLGSAGWWHKDSRHYITTQAFDSIVIA